MVVDTEFVGAAEALDVLRTTLLMCKVCNGFLALSEENLALEFCGGTMLAVPLD